MGFVIASLVRTARFAQPVAALVFYPMLAIAGLFAPIEAMPSGLQVLARVLPMTYAGWCDDQARAWWQARLPELAGPLAAGT